MMFGSARHILRQADEALKHGRLEEALRLVGLPEVVAHRDAEPLRQRLVKAFVERGERRFGAGESEAAWGDLLKAEQTGSASPDAERLRHALGRRGLDQVRVLLTAGEPARAVDAMLGLHERGVRSSETDHLGEAARNWLLARELADRGEFAQAVEAVERARRLVTGPAAALEEFRVSLKQRQDVVASHLVPLHAAAEKGNWGGADALCEKVLAAAPDHKEARRLRSLAWRSAEPSAFTMQTPFPNPAPAVSGEKPMQRFVLWIDGGGGYLVCLGTRVTLGQAVGDAVVDVPILADVSRIHAAVVRDGEGYLLEALRPARLNDQPINRGLLKNGDRVTLGPSCQLQFHQPSPVSASARLDLVSRHRLPLALDGVLLMADTLVLGPGSRAHVQLPGAREPVVLYRHKDGLGVRGGGSVKVDGQPVEQRRLLGWSGTVAGDEFAFTLEAVGAQLGRAG